jgi:hypothetical protein
MLTERSGNWIDLKALLEPVVNTQQATRLRSSFR